MNVFKPITQCFKPRYSYRCAITGRWVSEAYAKANPSTTIRHVR